ncbi:type VII secretion protein EccB [Cryptosporangium japonicum]|uniref:Type VII secretion protein EccB n=2 Tax=Cryptosporangium japonicum TaxID=80872 RepID=A0ABN0U5S3_9ACTN
MSNRLVSALVMAEPDAAEPPLRRTSVGLSIGIALAVLLALGFAAFGFVANSGKAQKWRSGGALVLEKETGTRYLLADGELRPVLNEASARLLLGADYQVESVRKKTLADYLHGLPVGIVGAPDALPSASSLDANVWMVCGAGDMVTLRLGAGADLGSDVTPVAADRGVLVRVGDEDHLLWRDRHYVLGAPWVAGALGFDRDAAVPVSSSLLNTLRAGPALTSAPVPGRGSAGPELDGRATVIGQLFVVHTPGGADRFYQVRRDGLRAVTETEAALVLGDPATRGAYPDGPPTAVVLTAAALADAKKAKVSAESSMYPPKPPTVTNESMPCVGVALGSGSTEAAAVLVATSQLDGRIIPEAPGVTRDGRVADRIGAMPGSGALVRPSPGGAALGVSFFLVTEAGVKYPVADADTVSALGYDPAAATGVQPALLALLPTGPVLRPLTNGGG